MESDKLILAKYNSSSIENESPGNIPKMHNVGKKKMLIKRLRSPSEKIGQGQELVTCAQMGHADRLQQTGLNVVYEDQTGKSERSLRRSSKDHNDRSSKVSELLDFDGILKEVGVDERTRTNFHRNMQILMDKMESTMTELLSKHKKNGSLNKSKPPDRESLSDNVAVPEQPALLYQVFNEMAFNLLYCMSLSDTDSWYGVSREKPFDTETLERRRVESLEQIRHIRDTEARWRQQIALHGDRWLLRMWNLSVETCVDEKLLYDITNSDCYLVPTFSFFDSLHLDKYWDVLSLKQKSDTWKTLRQMQTLSDLVDIIPEELIVGLLRLSDDLTNVKIGQGVTELDAVTFMMLKNHLVFSGLGKFAIMLAHSLSNKPTLVTAPSFQTLLQKAQSY